MGYTVILANGDFPRAGTMAREVLEKARRIVACDGAADVLFRRMKLRADFVIGDLDSLRNRRCAAEVVRVAEQESNDLAKAIEFCRRRGWRQLVIVGATGKREDHTLGNVFRAMAAGVPVVTDTGKFVPFGPGELRLRVPCGTAVSVFATDPKTRMRSTGLEWPLDAVRFTNLYCATLNRTNAPCVRITSTFPAFIYVAAAR